MILDGKRDAAQGGLAWGAGGTVALPPLGFLDRWRALVEVVGGWPRGYDPASERYGVPLSARGGVRWLAWRGLSVELGAGAGLGEAGYGREAWRVFGGVRWSQSPAPPPPDDDLEEAWELEQWPVHRFGQMDFAAYIQKSR